LLDRGSVGYVPTKSVGLRNTKITKLFLFENNG